MGEPESEPQQPSGAGHPTFAALLRKYRVAAGLSQERLAERAGMSAQALSALENGRRQAPYRHSVTLLAGAMGLTAADALALEAAVVRARSVAEETPSPLAPPAQPSTAPDTTDPPAAPLTHAARTNLPFQVSSFIGREADQEGVRGLLVTGRLVTLTGAGGSGKTRLALQVAGAVLGEYQDGVWLAELAPLADPAGVPAVVAAAVGVREEAGQPLLATLVAALRSRHLLLVLPSPGGRPALILNP